MTNQPSASESGELNNGMHDSIFVKVWGDAGGGDAGRRALAQYAFDLGRATQPVAAPTAGNALSALPEKIGTIYSGNYWTGLPDANPPGSPLADVYTADQMQAYARAALANQPAPTAAPEQVAPAIPTGEQLYLMVTGRFKQGSLPWAMASESGKAAWSAAAADLIFAPDTIAAQLSHALALAHQPAQEQAEPVAWMLDFGDERVATADRKEVEAWATQHDNPYTPIPLFAGAAPQAPVAAAPVAAQHEAGTTEKSAPMADHDARFAIDAAIMFGRENVNKPPSEDHWLYEYWNIGRQLAELGKTSGWDNVTPVATSPVVRAQSEERERAPKVDALRLFLGAAYPVHASIDPRGYSWSEAYLDQARAAALAQYATGGLLLDEKYLVGAGLPVASAQQAHAGADEDRNGGALWRATLRACGELPEGYEVRIELENGCGMVVWYDADGERHVIDGEGHLSDDVDEAVDAAIRAAQEGGAAC